MALHRARWILVVSSLLTLIFCSLSDAQQPSAPGRARVKSDAAPPTGNRVKVRPASEEEAPAKGRPQRETRTPRPEPKELRVEPLEPELEKLLKEWEVASSKITTLSGAHERIVYNNVFEVEKWAKGEFFYESPDKGRIDMEGQEPTKDDKSKKTNPKTGEPFRLEADAPTKWICTGKAVLNINDKAKEYEMFELPEEMQGKNIIHGPLPFLFGMKAEEAKRRFELSFDTTKKSTKEIVWIKAVPRQVMDRDNFKEATIMLDRTRFLPLAVKLVDPSENVETVYKFPKDKLHVNKRSLVPQIFRDKPFDPRLAGYKRMMSDVQLADEGDKGVRPAGNEVPAPQKSQKKTADPRPPGDTKKPRK